MNNKTIKYIRSGILAIVTIYVTIAFYQHQLYGGQAAPSVHALCPFGGLESLYGLIAEGSLIQKIFPGTMILLAVTIVLAVLFSRSFCGLICPFGAIQELFGSLGRRMLRKRKRMIVPAKIDKPLRYLKYIILIVTAGYAWKTAGLWMAPYDPWSAYAHLSSGLESVWSESAVGLILLVVTICGSFAYERFFCKYLCPMGAFYAVIAKISPHRINRNEDICISCGKCSRTCPVNIDVRHTSIVKSAECINCQLCVLECPKAGALEIKEGKFALKPIIAMSLVLMIFFGSIAIAQALGFYQLTASGGGGAVVTENSIQLNEVKGSMTISEAAKATGTPLDEFYEIYQIPSDIPETTQMKQLGTLIPGYSLDAVKDSL